MKKTWHRETALALLVVLCWTIYNEDVEMVKVIVYPVLTYAALAYGLKRADTSDWVRKQPLISADGGRSERSCQYSDREDEPTDSGVFTSCRAKPDKPYSGHNNSVNRYPEGKG